MDSFFKQHGMALAAGVVSALCFGLIAAGQAGNGPSLYLPLFPLLVIGLWKGVRPLLIASLLSMLLIFVLIGGMGGLMHTLFAVLPTLQFVRGALLRRQGEERTEWYPISQVLMNLTFYAISVYLLICWGLDNSGGIAKATDVLLMEIAKSFPPELRQTTENFARSWPFVYPAIYAWLWLISYYGVAILANILLSETGRAQRPSLRLQPFTPPLWVLLGLVFAAIISLFDTGDSQFIGKSGFIILLLPYFLSGLAQLHERAKSWPSRALWLALVYLFVILALWPAMLFIGYGLFKQLQYLSGVRPGQQDRQNHR